MAKAKGPEVFVISKGPPDRSLSDILRDPPKLTLAGAERVRQLKASASHDHDRHSKTG